MLIPYATYPVGNSLYPLALDLFVPTVFFFFLGTAYRITRYLITYQKPFIPYPSSELRQVSSGHKIAALVNTFANSSRVGIRRKPITTAVGLLMHLALVLIIFLLAQHVVFWAYYFPPYSALYPLAIPEGSEDGLLALTTPDQAPVTLFVNDIWGPLTVILNGQFLTFILIIFLGIYLGHKLHVAAERLSLRAGDWWFFVLLYIDVLLGFFATAHIPDDVYWYDNLLGAHILVAEIIIATLPFTRGFHMFEFYLGKIREWYFMVYRRGEK